LATALTSDDESSCFHRRRALTAMILLSPRF